MKNYLKTELSDGVGRIVLNRPEKRNALSRSFIEELTRTIVHWKHDPSLRAVVLSATGSVFCAGMDLDEMQQRAGTSDSKQEWLVDSEVLGQLLSEIYLLPVPTVVALQGPVLAGGVGLVLACDLIVASEDAYLMLPEPIRGITAAMVTPLLIHRIGAGPAGQFLLSNEKISSRRGYQIGLCHDVVSSDQLAGRIDKLIKAILSGSKSAIATTKQHLAQCSGSPVVEQIKLSIGVSALARESADAREGLAAFLEKRKPSWQED